VSDDRRTLYVHVMHVDSVEATRRDIKDGLERRVLQLMR
jgi:multicomponent Na+:H+ antiporter subunit E